MYISSCLNHIILNGAVLNICFFSLHYIVVVHYKHIKINIVALSETFFFLGVYRETVLSETNFKNNSTSLKVHYLFYIILIIKHNVV